MSSIEKDHAMSTLTDEEREALQSDEFSPEEIAAMQGIAGDDDQGDDGDDDDEDAEASTPPAAPIDGDSGKPEAAAAIPDIDEVGETEAEEPAEVKPVKATPYRSDLPDDFQAKVDQVQADLTDLARKFKEGDIDFDEFMLAQADIYAQRDALNAQRIKAEIATDMGSQSVENEWRATVATFTSDTIKADKIDYAKDMAKQADLDMFVKALSGDESNADKPMRWFLDEAHRRVKALHNIETTKPAQGDAPAKPDRKPNTKALPASLAHVPGGTESADIGGDEFASLDNLDGIELEAAIAKMSPAQQAKYLATA